MKKFLKVVSKYYQIYIFTASTYAYANVIVNYLDPKGEFIAGILDRSYCKEVNKGTFIKDLRIIKNREMKDIFLVDNMPHSFSTQMSNGIPIISWTNDQSDTELIYLADYLIEASFKDNLMKWNEEKLKLSKLASYKENDLRKKISPLIVSAAAI